MARYINLSPEEREARSKRASENLRKLWAERYDEMRAKSGAKKGYTYPKDAHFKPWTPELRAMHLEASKKGGRRAAELRAQNPNWGKEHSEKVKAYYARKKENAIWENLLEPLMSLW